MSMTHSIGVVGPSHWSYMAATLAERLENILQKKRIEENSIPRGIYAVAKEFFHLIEQALRQNGTPENPPASIKAYVIASDATRSALETSPLSAKEIETSLARYVDFVNQLQHGRELTGEDLEIAQSLKRFFHQLYLDGESEAYEAGVRETTGV